MQSRDAVEIIARNPHNVVRKSRVANESPSSSSNLFEQMFALEDNNSTYTDTLYWTLGYILVNKYALNK